MKKYFLLLLMMTSLQTFAELPPRPKDFDFVHDYANLLKFEDKEEINFIVKETFDNTNVPIVVVTIERMRDYVDRRMSIESFAKDLFNHWAIGTEEDNKGILVLVSKGDRKARIELGADWGHRWNTYTKNIMDLDMVYSFKDGKYSEGILNGVKSLKKMATFEPTSMPESPSTYEKLNNFRERQILDHPMSTKVGFWNMNIILFVGIAFIILSFFVNDPKIRKLLLITGGIIVALILLYGVTVIVLYIYLSLTGKIRGGSGGFGGGSSGGGGASGSW